MAAKEHLRILEQGVDAWNEWRKANDIRTVDLSEVICAGLDLKGVNFAAANLVRSSFHKANLADANLRSADLSNANLTEGNLQGANLADANLNEAKASNADFYLADLRAAKLQKANLYGTDARYAVIRGADFREAQLVHADFSYVNSREQEMSDPYLSILARGGTDFSGANLYGAILNNADLHAANFLSANLTSAKLDWTNLSGAILRGTVLHRASLLRADITNADLRGAILVDADLRSATLTGSRVFGMSAWRLNLENTVQNNLIITDYNEAIITVDNLEVAQFIYLILNNKKIRDVINTITSKAVLILGRFTPPERKVVLNAMRDKLRQMNFLPVVFDFEKPTDRDFTETLMTLAGMSLFIIADITNPRSSPLELQSTVPDYMIPFVPILQEGEDPFSMFADLQNKFHWVLDVRVYDTTDNLIRLFEEGIVKPALAKHDELLTKKTEKMRSVKITAFSTLDSS